MKQGISTQVVSCDSHYKRSLSFISGHHRRCSAKLVATQIFDYLSNLLDSLSTQSIELLSGRGRQTCLHLWLVLFSIRRFS